MQKNLLRVSSLALQLARPARVLMLLALAACGGGESDNDFAPYPGGASTDAGSSSSLDSALPSTPANTIGSTSPSSAGSSTGSSSTGSSSTDSSTPASAPALGRDSGSASNANDAGPAVDLDGILGGLFGDEDGGSRASGGDGGSGEWKLQPESAEECPEEPPPIPLIGGPCLGLYYSCDWKNASGETYTCICDWVHWLCV